MSEQKHTPGPWTYEGEEPAENGRMLTVACIIAKTGMVAEFIDAPSFANASLIAASPRLLAALKATQQALEDDCQDTERWFEIMGENAAAIAEAEGGGHG